MSIKVMNAVFDRYPSGGGERVLALALADHAHDDGSHVFPGIPLLAKKSFQSERTVQRQLQSMVDAGWLILVRKGGRGPKDPSEYCINLDWINGGGWDDMKKKGDILSPLEKGDKNASKGDKNASKGDKNEKKGDTAMSPEPYNQLTKDNQPAHGQAREAAELSGADGSGRNEWGEAEVVAALSMYKVSSELAKQWMLIRKTKGRESGKDLSITSDVLERIDLEAKKAFISFASAIRCCCDNGWAWFMAKWFFVLEGKERYADMSQQKAPSGDGWKDSQDGCIRRGAELGVTPRPGESSKDFMRRVSEVDYREQKTKATAHIQEFKNFLPASRRAKVAKTGLAGR